MHKANIHLMTLKSVKGMWISSVYPTDALGKASGISKLLSTTHQKTVASTSISILFYPFITHRFSHIIHNPTHALQSVTSRLYTFST